ncbi:MAG: PVC-type heme-binding CxxCH protein [Opitutales bacterium]
MRCKLLVCLSPFLSLTPPATQLFAAESTAEERYSPSIAAASDEGHQAIQGFQVPSDLEVRLWAAEPMLANPVAFRFDEQGRAYLAETFRHSSGVMDIRGIMPWLDEELANRTVDDRIATMKRHLGDRISQATEHSERVRLIEDRDGDGVADRSTVFADGFNEIADGIGAGVLPRKGKVWYTNIPHLWQLSDTTGDGEADIRESVHYGYGVRVGFLGHDLHGLRIGPDGKLYFSIGDRGFNVQTGDGRTVAMPDTGAVLRCNLDGSDLEVVHYGLRNPQDLTFDQYGNLFTGDNDADGGDRARWVHIVEGGDSGWHIGWQFIRSPNHLGPWNSERLWHERWDEQAAYLVPPVSLLGNGPSGITYHPGVAALPDRYQEHFFVSDFRGGANSGIHTFQVEPKGASFELVNLGRFIWENLPTDVEFSPDGKIYWSDWVQGWSKPGKGRLYQVFDPEKIEDALVLQTRDLLGEGMEERSAEELRELLSHADMRVRQEAQFELADRRSADTLLDVARNEEHQLARIHAIWGLGQTARHEAAAVRELPELLSDADAEVRAQAAKVLGDSREESALEGLIGRLQDSSPRVRFFAAISLGKLGDSQAVDPLLELLRENEDSDPYLRHAGMMGLAGINSVPALIAAADDDSAAVRMGSLLAMRRLQRPEIIRFLSDSDPLLVVEAARAINDHSIRAGMTELAALIDQDDLPESEPLIRRVLNANFRMGTAQTASALARFAANGNASEKYRAEALQTLAEWPDPSGRDRVTGLWRPVPGRSDSLAPEALKPVISEILTAAPEGVRIAAARAAGRLGIEGAGDDLFTIVTDVENAASLRVEALKALDLMNDARLGAAVGAGMESSQEALQNEAIRLQAEINPAEAIAPLISTLEEGSPSEQQSAFAALGAMEGSAADIVLSRWMDKLLEDDVRPEIKLDLLEAARLRSDDQIEAKLAQYEEARPSEDPLAPFYETLYGGNPENGHQLFVEHPAISCLRCHNINGGEGEKVGPNLSGIGSRESAEFLLQSIVTPSRSIAPGYESLFLTTTDGTTVAGILQEESDEELVLASPAGESVTVSKSEIQSRLGGISSMPPGLHYLIDKKELRDLVAFLKSLE